MSRVVLIHAVAVAMPPIEAAFQALWPEAERTNLLQDAELLLARLAGEAVGARRLDLGYELIIREGV